MTDGRERRDRPHHAGHRCLATPAPAPRPPPFTDRHDLTLPPAGAPMRSAMNVDTCTDSNGRNRFSVPRPVVRISLTIGGCVQNSDGDAGSPLVPAQEALVGVSNIDQLIN